MLGPVTFLNMPIDTHVQFSAGQFENSGSRCPRKHQNSYGLLVVQGECEICY